MKTIRSKLWSVASGNQTVSGGGGDGGGRRDQNQSIPNFVRGYNYKVKTYFKSPTIITVNKTLKIFKTVIET
jgi:hypothetical protein